MIDKNGKVFGKINIIDLIVIIVLVAAVAFFVFSQLNKADFFGGAVDKDIYMEFYAEEVSDFVIEKLEKGAKLYDNDAKTELGEVVDFKTAPAISYGTNSEGQVVTSSKEHYKSLTIKAKINGKTDDYGLEARGTKYGVGHSLTIRAGSAKIYLRVSDIFIEEKSVD